MGCGGSKAGGGNGPVSVDDGQFHSVKPDDTSDYEHLFKLVIIGDSGVGKSCIVVRFAEGTYSETYLSTLGVDFKMKLVEVDGVKIKLQIWDTAGQERFRTITQSYYRGSNGILIVYDVTDRKSFDNCKYWLTEINKVVNESGEKVVRLLIGNKSDLANERQVPTTEGESLAKQQGLFFVETSAKDRTGISEAFEKITREALKNKK
eukprot:TRINITY_DN1677_c0_g1_i2.p1 TRINITY_DN1677_c0_g1~~TRINITY_DN1677_c0_g1_i2.p1  ORF type:complete len:214 (-),score=53.41 TRINITY_DN1677_c0_g1_i2:526-1143(-)